MTYGESDDYANFEEASAIAADEIQQFGEYEEEHSTGQLEKNSAA